MFYGYPRFTGDVDVFYDRSLPNAERLFATLPEFWGGPVPAVSTAAELAVEGMVFQFGRPPNRIDLLECFGNSRGTSSKLSSSARGASESH